MSNPWHAALKKYNAELQKKNKDAAFQIPKKDSVAYKQVKKLEAGLNKEKKPKIVLSSEFIKSHKKSPVKYSCKC